LQRALDFPFPALAVGEVAGRLQAEDLGVLLQLHGFLAPRRARSTRLVIHVTEYRRDPSAPAETN
jgi:primosomal replication protein N